MESVYQDHEEQVFEEVALSPSDQFRLQWNQQPGFIALIKQKNVIDQNAELLQYAGVVRVPGWLSPLAFAMQTLVAVAVVASFFNWYATHDRGRIQEEIVALQATTQAEVQRQEEIMSATRAEIKRISRSSNLSFRFGGAPMSHEQAIQQLNSDLDDSSKSEEQYKREMAIREHNLRAKQSALALVNSGTPLLFSLALVLCAGVVRKSFQKDYNRNRHYRRAEDFYLYIATAEGLLPNLVFLVFLHFALSGSIYGLSNIFDGVGPLFWGLFWIGFYFLVLRYFVIVARDMYKAMELRVPHQEWSPDNTILLRIHNSFWITFAALEGGFLLLCYVLYLAAKHF